MLRLCNIGEKDNLENINKNLVKQRDFLKEHLLSWIFSWVKDVNQNTEIRFWAGFAQMTKGWLENDLDEIENVIAIRQNLE